MSLQLELPVDFFSELGSDFAQANTKNTGSVFTQQWVVENILDLVGYRASDQLSSTRILDPAVGHGAFIIPIVRRLVESARRYSFPLSDLGEAIFGLDIQPENVDRTRSLVRIYLEKEGVSPQLAQMLASRWINHGDYLLSQVPDKFDFIVGNPPYIRLDNLDKKLASHYRARWSAMRGRGDIYIGFYQRSLDLLSPEGVLGFICADRWMKNSYGKDLRKIVAENYVVDALWQMHHVDAFEGQVAAYPAITVISRKNFHEKSTVILEANEQFNGNQSEEAVRFTLGSDIAGEGKNWSAYRVHGWGRTDSFWPTGRPEIVAAIELLGQRYPSIGDNPDVHLNIGVATGADKVYVVPADSPPEIEGDRLLPLVMSKDLGGSVVQGTRHYLVNPWGKEGGLVEASKYPKMINYLSQHEVIFNRFIVKKNPSSWYRTIDKVNWDSINKPKLLFQDMKSEITPVLEPGGLYPHHNLYYITSDIWDLEVLGGVLLSKIAEEFVNVYGVKMRGGTMRFQAQYLKNIAIPQYDCITEDIKAGLKEAFRLGDRKLATQYAARAYGIEPGFFIAEGKTDGE